MHVLALPDHLRGQRGARQSADGVLVAYRRSSDQAPFRVLVRDATLVYVRRGTKRLHHGDCGVTVPAGGAVLMRPGLHVMSEQVASSFESTLVSFSAGFLRDFETRHPMPTADRAPDFTAFTPPPLLRDSLQHLPRFLQHASGDELLRIKLSELCLALLESEAKHTLHGAMAAALPSGDQRIRSVVEAHRFAPVSIEELASLAGCSPSSFKRAFRRIYGESPGRWLRIARLDRARALLFSGLHSVTDVGFRSGFADTSAFIRAFRNHYGTTPKQFQLAQRPSPPQ